MQALLGLAENDPEPVRWALLHVGADPTRLEDGRPLASVRRSIERRLRKHIQKATYLANYEQSRDLQGYAALHSSKSASLVPPPLPLGFFDEPAEPHSTAGGLTDTFPDAPVPSVAAIKAAAEYVASTAAWELVHPDVRGRTWIKGGKVIRAYLTFQQLGTESEVARTLAAVALAKLAPRFGRKHRDVRADELRSLLTLELQKAAAGGYPGLLRLVDRTPSD